MLFLAKGTVEDLLAYSLLMAISMFALKKIMGIRNLLC